MAQENLKSYLTGISHSVASMLAASSHTLALLMSKPRSSLDAGKKQPRVWLEYACSVTEVLLYSSFGAPLVLLKGTRYIHGPYTDYVRKIREFVSTAIESLKARSAKGDVYGGDYSSIEDPAYKFERDLNDYLVREVFIKSNN